MAYRLALVACVGAAEGAWTYARGNERAVEIIHLLDGERVRLDVDTDGHQASQFFVQPGQFPVEMHGCKRYRISKEVTEVSSAGAPTIARVVLQ